MICRNHLRKINERNFSIFSNEQIELVQIAVNETMSSEADNQGHKLVVDLCRLIDFFNLTKREARAKFHDDDVTIAIDGFRNREFSIVESFGKRYLINFLSRFYLSWKQIPWWQPIVKDTTSLLFVVFHDNLACSWYFWKKFDQDERASSPFADHLRQSKDRRPILFPRQSYFLPSRLFLSMKALKSRLQLFIYFLC